MKQNTIFMKITHKSLKTYDEMSSKNVGYTVILVTINQIINLIMSIIIQNSFSQRFKIKTMFTSKKRSILKVSFIIIQIANKK